MDTQVQENNIFSRCEFSIEPQDQVNALMKSSSEQDVKTILYQFQKKGINLDFQRCHSATKTITYFFSLPTDQYSEISKISCSDICQVLELALKKRKVAIEVSAESGEIGVSLPLDRSEFVRLAPFLDEIKKETCKLPFILGEDIYGQPQVVDLAECCHQLIGGFTGSGKSMFLRAVVTSLAVAFRPEDVNMILMDGKGLDLNIFRPLRHLVCPIITERHEAIMVLGKLLKELERRKTLLKKHDQVDIWKFNDGLTSLGVHRRNFLPPILVIIDEVQNLIDNREGLSLLRKLTQQGRACGIIICAATQRPSVDILQGSIKTNFPGRIAFQLSSQVDSRVILDCGGAENLSEPGEFLTIQAKHSEPMRLFAPYVDDQEIKAALECHQEEDKEDFCEQTVILPQKSLHALPQPQNDASIDGKTEDKGYEVAVEQYVKIRVGSEEYIHWLNQTYGDYQWKYQLVYYPFLLARLVGLRKKEVLYDFLGHSLIQKLSPFEVIHLTRYFRDMKSHKELFSLLTIFREKPSGLVSDDLVNGHLDIVTEFQKKGIVQIQKNRYRLNKIFKKSPGFSSHLLFSEIPETGVQHPKKTQKQMCEYEEILRETLYKVWDMACEKISCIALPLYVSVNENDLLLCHFACMPAHLMVNVKALLHEEQVLFLKERAVI